MEVIPAIDLRGGRCVRLYQGDYARETVFSDDPVAVARRWEGLGALRLHLVDLDGAEAGEPRNMAAIKGILEAVRIPVQLGGGVRTLETVERLLEMGLSRVIMGTAADRIGNRLATTICLCLISADLFWLLATSELWMFYLFAALFGFTYGGLVALMSPLLAELFGLGSLGVVLGVVHFIWTAGEAIGPTLAGRIFDTTGSYQPAFLVCAVLGVIAIILALFLKPITDVNIKKGVDSK